MGPKRLHLAELIRTQVACERFHRRVRRHVRCQLGLEGEARRADGAGVTFLSAVPQQMPFEVISFREGLVALIAAERLLRRLLVRHHVLPQFVVLQEAFAAGGEVAGERLKALVAQHVVDQVVAHSHLLGAVNALMRGVFDVRARVADEIGKLWIRLGAQRAGYFGAFDDIIAMVLHVLDAVVVVGNTRQANHAGEHVARFVVDFGLLELARVDDLVPIQPDRIPESHVAVLAGNRPVLVDSNLELSASIVDPHVPLQLRRSLHSLLAQRALVFVGFHWPRRNLRNIQYIAMHHQVPVELRWRLEALRTDLAFVLSASDRDGVQRRVILRVRVHVRLRRADVRADCADEAAFSVVQLVILNRMESQLLGVFETFSTDGKRAGEQLHVVVFLNLEGWLQRFHLHHFLFKHFHLLEVFFFAEVERVDSLVGGDDRLTKAERLDGVGLARFAN